MRRRHSPLVGLAAVVLVIVVLMAFQGLFFGPARSQGQTTGTSTALDVTVKMLTPRNGSHFVVGDQTEVTITLKDKSGSPLTRNDFATLGLYMYGPQETTKTVTAVKLLNATADRSQTPHHYIDLLTNTSVRVEGNTLKYTLQPVSDEEPGTYTVMVRAVKKGDTPNQMVALSDFQLGTATVEKQIVEKEKCAACHQGAASGQFYFAHTDPSGTNAFGSPSLDSVPVRTCKACHNNDGYAAFRSPADGSRVPDQIVRRVHGVHMGEELKNPINTDPATGVFRDYTGVVFPANVKNCTSCHVDDRWKTQASRLACGACHDNTWFGETASMPATAKAHSGGPQANDSSCAVCHTPDTGGLKPISVAHKVEVLPAEATIDLALSAPANGKFYTAGEKPTLSITFKDPATGAAIDPSTITEAGWNSTRLQVSGPRGNTQPVLTAAAADRSHSGSTSYVYNDLRVRTDNAKENPGITRSPNGITYQLGDVAGLKSGTYTIFVQARKAGSSAPVSSSVALTNFQVSSATPEPQVATNCTSCHGDTKMHGNYPFALAPDICKNCHDYERQIQGRSGWNQNNNGFGAGPFSRRVHGVHFGRYLEKPSEVHATVDYSEVIFPQDVRNCTKCHTAETSGTWKTKPSRLACLGCHDQDPAIAHAALQTVDRTPNEPYSGQQTESCIVCHGASREFSPDKMHNISSPYKPPYPREP